MSSIVLFRPARRSDVTGRGTLLQCLAALAMAVALLFAAPASAQTFPELTGRVVDQANLLSAEQELDLSSKSAALEQQSGRQFVVATVNSLEGRDIEDYGYRLGRHWGIGREKEDDGVILLVAPNEKKVRIETGYGAEGFLPDILAGRIIRNTILPRFRDGDMAGGITAGADAILSQMSLPPDQARETVARAQAQEAARKRDSAGFIPIVFWFMVIAFILLSMVRRSGGRRYRSKHGDGISPWIILWGLSELGHHRRRGGWGGGGWGGGSSWGGGGGFGGFSGGGGGFGGGGASGSW